MSYQEFIPADKAKVCERPGGNLIEIPENRSDVVVERRCDVGAACARPRQRRVDHHVQMQVTGHGHPATSVGFDVCDACLRAVVPNPVRLMLAQFGLDIGPGLQPD